MGGDSIVIYTDNLPLQLRSNGLFCCWRYEERKGKRTKVPYNPRTGGKAQSTNPDTFASLPVALEAMQRGGYDGVGVGIFGALGAIDIDHCIDENGELSAMALEVMELMQGYTEKSPSGHGLRILFNAAGFQYDKTRFYINNQKAGLEVYIAGCTQKYVTVTGDALTPGLDLEERGAQLAAVLEKYMRRQEKTSTADKLAAGGSADLDDLALIGKAQKSSTGFSALWAGDASAYNSGSEADLALCNALAWWTNSDAQRMDRLFRQSGLFREKWDRRQSGSTYGAITIQKAIADCRGGYDPQTYSQQTSHASVEQMESVKPPDYSDMGNVEVFSRIYQNTLVFTDALGWLIWNGKQWQRNDHKAMMLAQDLSARMLKEAQKENRNALAKIADAQARYMETDDTADKDALEAAQSEAKAAKAYLSHAKTLRSASRLKSMLDLSKPYFLIKTDQLDANPFDLNTPAGIVDLTTGHLRPHDRAAYCSKITAVSPATEGAELWYNFLDTITCGDSSVAGFLQLVAGMALIGAVYQEGIIIANGGGRNGKSTFFNALGAVLGDYSGGIDIKTLTTDRVNKGAALATLRGKRLVISGELEEGQRLSTSTLKQVASTDKLIIEEKYKQPEEVTQTHSIVLFTNHLPRVGSTDGGTWRRLIVVPFNATISTGLGIQNYADVLAKTAGGAILSWAIEGAVNFVRNGYKLDIPDVVAEATAEYREREDWLSNFIHERCIREPNAREGARALYMDYKEWATEAGEFVYREREFSAALGAAGYRRIVSNGRKYWVGLRGDPSVKYGFGAKVAAG